MVLPGELAVLTALATGPIAEYEPTIDPETGEISYPKAAQYLNSDDARSSAVLDAFAERNILGKTFEEKTHICPDCRTAEMEYMTGCPVCESAYIVETELFEHRECGHTAPRTRFEVVPGEFLCPECETNINSTDTIERRPGQICRDCESSFETPEHGLRCQTCAQLYALGEPVERVLCRYSLTDSGHEWVETQLVVRDSLAETLTERGFEPRVNTTIEGGSGSDHSVHVFAEDPLLDRRVVAMMHERPDSDDATTVCDIADDVDAQPLLITTRGAVGEQVVTLADQGDITVLNAQTEGTFNKYDYNVPDDPHPRESLVQ